MHRSRLFGLFVDAPIAEAGSAVDFWAGALGSTARRAVPDDPYVVISGGTGDLRLEVQAVDDTPRYHVDIETDDVAAETARLIRLGAVEHTRQPGWVVLRAPGGHLLCVVPVQSPRASFEAQAHTWAGATG